MKITYKGAHDGVRVPLPNGLEVEVTRDETVDLPEDLAKNLLKQKDAWAATPTSGKGK